MEDRLKREGGVDKFLSSKRGRLLQGGLAFERGVARPHLNPFPVSAEEIVLTYHTLISFYRNVSTLSKTLTPFYTLFTKATSRSVFAKIAASDGTSSSTTPSARTRAQSMQSCQGVWASTIHSIPMAESKAFAKHDFLQGQLGSVCRWKIVRDFQGRGYRII